MKELEYISSAGLRVLMIMRKALADGRNFSSQKKEALAALPMLSSVLTKDEMKMVRVTNKNIDEF